MSELPSGWASCYLSDVVNDAQAGFASGKKDVKEGLPHLRMNNISVDGKLNLDLIRTVPRSLANQNHYLEKGDVLVCTTNSGTLVGKSALFEVEGEFAFSNHLTRLRVKPHSVDTSYIHHQLWLLWKNGEFERKCKHWVNQSTLPKPELLSTEILIPPLNEQRRIVAKLEKLLSRVDAAQERLATIPQILKRFRQSVLDSAIAGRISQDWRSEHPQSNQAAHDLELFTKQRAAQRDQKVETCEGRVEFEEIVPESWETPMLGELFTFIDYRGRNPPKAKQGKRLITAKNIRMGYLSDTPVDFVSEDTYKKWMTRGFPKRGDILFVTEGATMGFVAPNHRDNEFALAQRTLTLQPLHAIDTRAFLYFIMSSPFQRLVSINATGSAAVGIKAARFRGLPIPFPPLAEQQEIVRRVEALFKTADALEARYLKAKAHVDKLTQSILAKAFRGELVPQDPNDEPASVLLEKIAKDAARARPLRVASGIARPRQSHERKSIKDL